MRTPAVRQPPAREARAGFVIPWSPCARDHHPTDQGTRNDSLKANLFREWHTFMGLPCKVYPLAMRVPFNSRTIALR